jgi:hypothetical protein
VRITYTLSNRQRKELLVRDCPLEIAIPVGPDEIDPMEFARASLPEDSEWIVSAELGEVCVVANRADSGLASALGQIVDYGRVSSGAIPYFVAVVLVSLQSKKPRNNPMQVMWPGRAFFDGVEIGQRIEPVK